MNTQDLAFAIRALAWAIYNANIPGERDTVIEDIRDAEKWIRNAKKDLGVS